MSRSTQKTHAWQPPNREGLGQFTNIFVLDIVLFCALDATWKM